MTQTDIQTNKHTNKPAERGPRKVRDAEIDNAAFEIIAAVIDQRARLHQYGPENFAEDGTLRMKTLIVETHRMADYLQATYGRDHFAFMADYDGVIDRLIKHYTHSMR